MISKTELADLVANGMAGLSVLAVGAIMLLALRHTMRSCECCSAPTEDESEESGDDPDRWRDYEIADERGAL